MTPCAGWRCNRLAGPSSPVEPDNIVVALNPPCSDEIVFDSQASGPRALDHRVASSSACSVKGAPSLIFSGFFKSKASVIKGTAGLTVPAHQSNRSRLSVGQDRTVLAERGHFGARPARGSRVSRNRRRQPAGNRQPPCGDQPNTEPACVGLRLPPSIGRYRQSTGWTGKRIPAVLSRPIGIVARPPRPFAGADFLV